MTRNGSAMRVRIEGAAARRTAELLNKNKSRKNRNDFMTFHGVAFETQSFTVSRPGIDST